MDIDIRSGVRAAALSGPTPAERQAWRFLPDPRAREADPVAIRAQAARHEADGFDSALVTTYSGWPDPWLVAMLTLEASSTLRTVVAHRPGVMQPTAAARMLATLDRLSGGRASMHVVIGSSDSDVRRDGDFSTKDERYRRAFEYLEVLTRAVESPEPFDFDGAHYRVRDAWNGFRAVQGPRPPISVGGTSEAARHLAARFADIYAGAYATPEEVVRVRGDLEERHGRRVGIWKSFSVVLGDSDGEARRTASSLVDRARRLASERTVTDLATSAQLAAVGDMLDRGEIGTDDLRSIVCRYVDNGVAGSLVGSVETVSDQLARFCDAGVDIVQIDTNVETPDDVEQRRALVAELRRKVGTPTAVR